MTEIGRELKPFFEKEDDRSLVTTEEGAGMEGEGGKQGEEEGEGEDESDGVTENTTIENEFILDGFDFSTGVR